jgi:hypothetical protein
MIGSFQEEVGLSSHFPNGLRFRDRVPVFLHDPDKPFDRDPGFPGRFLGGFSESGQAGEFVYSGNVALILLIPK